MQLQFHDKTKVYEGNLLPICELIAKVRTENEKLCTLQGVFRQESLMRLTQGLMESLSALLKGLLMIEAQMGKSSPSQEKTDDWNLSKTKKERIEWVPIKDFCAEFTYVDTTGKIKPLVSAGFLKTLRQLVPEVTNLSKKSTNGVWEVHRLPLIRLLISPSFFKRFPKYQKAAFSWMNQHLPEADLIMSNNESNESTQN